MELVCCAQGDVDEICQRIDVTYIVGIESSAVQSFPMPRLTKRQERDNICARYPAVPLRLQLELNCHSREAIPNSIQNVCTTSLPAVSFILPTTVEATPNSIPGKPSFPARQQFTLTHPPPPHTGQFRPLPPRRGHPKDKSANPVDRCRWSIQRGAGPGKRAWVL